MFERYDDTARRVVFFGRFTASQFGSSHLETEHLLLALLNEDREIANRFFGSPDPAAAIRLRIETNRKPDQRQPSDVDVPLSHAAKQVLTYANEEAKRQNDYHVAPAHLLLGLLRDKESLASQFLSDHNVDAAKVNEYLRLSQSHSALPAGSASPAPDGAMIQMITGFWASRALYTACKLGLADLLKDGPKSVADLASATASHPDSLYRMLRALASIGVFAELDGQHFASTPLAQTLEDRPGTLRYFALAELGQEHFSAWEEFPHSIRTGGMAFTERFKQPIWEYYAAHAEHAEVFHRAMSNLTEWVTQAILAVYDFSTFGKIVDIGGGQGAFLAAVLGKSPAALGVLFDAAPVIADATRLTEAGLAGRSEQVAGNFFEAVPAGGDLYTMKMILHDWNDEECHAILSNIRKVIAPSGKVLIVETVLGGTGPDAPFKNFLDLNMLVMTGGRERTEAGYRALLERAGFKLNRVIPTQSPVSIVEAVVA